jgi:hypothetical protein
MCRNRINFVLTVLVAVALAMPLAARANTGKNTKAGANARLDLVNDASIGGKRVKAGTYDVKADDTTLTLRQDGKVVAQAPIQWKDEASKSAYSSMVTEGGALLEVHFSGKTRYAEVSGTPAATTGQQ